MKKSLIIALALMLVLAFASSAMAAQVLDDGTYISTTTGVYYTPTSVENKMKTNTANQFDANTTTNYPYEIYLPNEDTPANYRIHSNYAKNTDACASCHSTHTAVGNSLLQWYSVYETCMACHDGTVTTTYDVFNGRIGMGKPAFGGAFSDQTDSNSNHNVTGALSISAAPGGSTTTAETVSLANGTQTRWIPTFGCESCHTPHGNGGNARILHPDANFAASIAKKASYQVNAFGAVLDGTTPVYILKGYPYKVVIKKAGVQVTEAYINNTSGVSQVVYPGGEVNATFTVEGTAGLQVKMTIGAYLEQTETVQHDSGMNAFCGACHTDYNTAAFVTSNSSDTLTGKYSQAHRHQVGVAPRYNDPQYGNDDHLASAGMVLENGKLECLTCHLAHGVNKDYWARTVGSASTNKFLSANATDDDAMLVELAGSSALKRLPNMGTCETCHQKGDSAQGYATSVAGLTGGQTDGSANWTNSSAAVFIANFAAEGVAPLNKAFFTQPGTFFKADVNVGSAKCGECHTTYYDVWKAGDHVRAGGNAVDQLKQAGKTSITMASGLNSKIRTYGSVIKIADMLSYTKVSNTVSIATYKLNNPYGDNQGNGHNYYFELKNTGSLSTTVIDVYDETAGSAHTQIAIKDVFVDGHAGEGYIYADKAVNDEVYPLDRLFPFNSNSAAYPENVYNGTFAPNLDIILYADKATEAEALERDGDACSSCHIPRFDAKFAAGVLDPGVGCEACHGAGSDHAVAPTKLNIFNPATNFTGSTDEKAEAQVDLCLTCHSSDAEEEHHFSVAGMGSYAIQLPEAEGGGFKDSKHFTVAKLVCTDCHDLHKATSTDSFITYSKAETLCGACHDTIGGKALVPGGIVTNYMYGNPASTSAVAGTAGGWNATLGSVSQRTYGAMNHTFESNASFDITTYPSIY